MGGQGCIADLSCRTEHILQVHGAATHRPLDENSVLALRKHRVTLMEKERGLGRLLRYAAVPDFKDELKGFVNYLKLQVQKLGVKSYSITELLLIPSRDSSLTQSS